MTNDPLMQRLAAAFPAEPTDPAPAAADELFAQIVAGPGDPDFTTAGRRRRTPLSPGRRVLISSTVVGVGAAAAAIVIATGPTVHGAANAGRLHIGGANARETAYVVHRLQANLPGDHWVTRSSAPGLATGDTSTGWTWTDPATGTEYSRSTETDPSGATVSVDWSATGRPHPAAHGQVAVTGRSVQIDFAGRTYTEGPMRLTYTPGETPAGLFSTPDQIAAALRSGTVSSAGRTTIDGTPAVALTISGEQNFTLYVDARTDQPLRTVLSSTGPATTAITTDLLPATDANVASAKAPGIPAGFTRRDH